MAAEPRHLLREAAERGDTDSIDSLLREQMGILDATCGRTAWTALHAAADRGRLESLRHLLGMRADPNLRTASGATALSLASRSGHLDCVQALLQVGAEPTEATGKNATTALHGAMRLDRTEVVRTLMVQGADPDQKTVAGVTARDLGGVEPLEQYSWQPHTASEILRDPYYLSETELAERYPPLESMIHSELYAAEARRAVIDAAGGGGVVEQGAREVAEAEEALAAERERAEQEKAALEMALAAVRTTTAPVFFACSKPFPSCTRHAHRLASSEPCGGATAGERGGGQRGGGQGRSGPPARPGACGCRPRSSCGGAAAPEALRSDESRERIARKAADGRIRAPHAPPRPCCAPPP